MPILRSAFALLAAAFAAFILASPAQAQASRTWVSGLGNDANPCSRTAPCKTFAGAYGNTAAGGEIDALDGGGYGTLTISKSITIDGGNGNVASILASGTNGITINGAGINVTLRNLSINGIGAGLAGVSVSNAANVNILNCEVQGFNQEGLVFSPSVAGSRLYVRNSTFHDDPGYGIAVVPTATSGTPAFATFDDVSSFHNGIGIAAFDNTRVSMTRSDITQNTAVGAESFGNNASVLAVLSLEETNVSNNSGNGLSTSGAGNPLIRISNTYISGNTGNSISVSSGQVTSFGNNRINDNGTNTGPSGTFVQQ